MNGETEYGAFYFGWHELGSMSIQPREVIPCIICLHTKPGDVCVDCGRTV